MTSKNPCQHLVTTGLLVGFFGNLLEEYAAVKRLSISLQAKLLVMAGVSALALAGCGSGNLPCVQVEVELKVNDEPFGPATMRFRRNGTKSNERTSVATIGSDGKGTISTYRRDDGVPIGDYKVTAIASGIGTSPIPMEYWNEKSTTLSAQVKADTSVLSFAVKGPKQKGTTKPGRIQMQSVEEMQEMAKGIFDQTK